jgi:hypothetical protein
MRARELMESDVFGDDIKNYSHTGWKIRLASMDISNYY